LFCAVRFGESLGASRCTSPRTGFFSPDGTASGSAASAVVTALPPSAESEALSGLEASTAVALAGAAFPGTFALLRSGFARAIAEATGACREKTPARTPPAWWLLYHQAPAARRAVTATSAAKSMPFPGFLGAFSLTFFTPSNGSSRSEEHTSELQSRGHLVCRLLLEKKKLTM